MSNADVRVSSREGAVVAHVSGEVDMSNARDISDAIASAASNDLIGVVIDLSEVDYLDSAGIHLIFRLREATRTRGQVLRLVFPESSPVAEALRLAGVTELVEIDRDIDGAVRGLPASSA